MELMTVTEAAKLWGITPRRVQAMCEAGQIKGATKLGFMWTLPKSSPKPLDGRTKAAKRINSISIRGPQKSVVDGD